MFVCPVARPSEALYIPLGRLYPPEGVRHLDHESKTFISDDSEDTQVAQVGRYLLRRRLPGSYPGQVYIGSDPYSGREVVVRVLEPHRAENPKHVEQSIDIFQNEIRYAAQVQHSRLPVLLDTGHDTRRYFAVYSYLDGMTVAEYLGTEGLVDSTYLELLVKHWAEALHSLHKIGLLHGDVRVSNLLIDAQKGGAVIDLSMVQPIEGVAHPWAGKNTAVRAPENLNGAAYDVQSEQFALGMVIYQALIGRAPFSDTSNYAEVPKWPEKLGVNVSKELSTVLRRLLSDSPEDRFGSLDEVISILGNGTKNPVGASTSSNGLSPPPRPASDNVVKHSESVSWGRALVALASRVHVLDDSLAMPLLLTVRAMGRELSFDRTTIFRVSLVTALGGLLRRQELQGQPVDIDVFVPSDVRHAVVHMLRLLNQTPGRTSPPPESAVGYVAYRYHELARAPEGWGTLSPRGSVLKLKSECENRLSRVYVKSLVHYLRSRLSALDL